MGKSSVRDHLVASGRVLADVSRSRALRRVELAFLLFNASEFGTWIAILLYAYDATGRGAVGLVAMSQLLPAGILAPVVSSLADRFPRDRVLAAGYMAQALAFAGTGAGMLVEAPPVLVYLAAAVAAIALTVTRPTQGGILPHLARTPDELIAANGLSGTIEGCGVLLGPLSAVVLLALAGPTAVLLAGSAACLVAFLLVVHLPVASGPSRATAGTSVVHRAAPCERVGAWSGLRAVSSDSEVRVVVSLLGLRQLTSGAMDILFVLLAVEVLETGGQGAAMLNASWGLGTVAGGMSIFALVGRRRVGHALAVSAALWGGAVLLLGAVTVDWLASALMVMGGVGYAACDGCGRTLLQRTTADRVLSSVLGCLEGIGLVALSAGAIIVPPLAFLIGVRWTLVTVGLLLPLAVALASVHLRRIDRRVSLPHRELSLLRTAGVLSALGAPQLERIARTARWVTAQPGHVLEHERGPGDQYFVLDAGRVRFTREGKEVWVAEHRGEAFGDHGMSRQVPQHATATALVPCVLLVVRRSDVLAAVSGE